MQPLGGKIYNLEQNPPARSCDAAGSATKIVFLPIYASCGALVQRDWVRSLSLESEFLTVSVSISIICTTDTVI